MLTSIAGANFSHRPGAVVDWKDGKEAKRLVSAGLARELSKAENAFHDEQVAEKAALAAKQTANAEKTAKTIADENKKRAKAAKKADEEKAELQQRNVAPKPEKKPTPKAAAGAE